MKPVPAIEALLIVTGDVPVDVSVRGCAVEMFTITLPKPRFEVLIDNCGPAGGGAAAVVPIPLRATTAVPSAAELLLMVICPVAAPAVVGWNCTGSVTVCIGFNVNGKLPPRIEKPAPVIDAEFTITGAVPVDVSVKTSVAAELIVTLPKLRFEVLADRFPSSPDPQPDVAHTRQQTVAKTKTVHQLSHSPGWVPGQIRGLFSLREGREGVERTRPGKAGITYLGDTNITS